MSAVIERRILDRLIALGRATGRISSDELRAHLPTATMTAEDIALVVLELEESGVEVEFEGPLETAGRPSPVRPVAELPPLPTAPAVAASPPRPFGRRIRPHRPHRRRPGPVLPGRAAGIRSPVR
ncbi:RNA polymerase sigma factor region1.1 domain-containing protein [Methylobacterium gregans]|uniref:RNA polymerase sigma factor region1.1 domain-containing protein n=1 Tax=Methylobacterium gregans TaxID=374424 RepID=UPI0036134942